MPIDSVSSPQSVKASTTNQLIGHVNNAGGRAIYTADGVFSVPSGIRNFRVTLCGRGGAPGDEFVGESTTFAGGAGGVSPLVSRVVTDQEPGSNFSIQVGKSTNDGSSSFSTLLTAAKGGDGADATGGGPGAAGSTGATTGAELRHANDMVMTVAGAVPGTENTDGIVIVEY